ncbi:hypothetical protein FRC02_007783 [Tulasnella sp. 418]|nr:hypothetical protein FRC02_007783 [Tulasnella sp. 418]
MVIKMQGKPLIEGFRTRPRPSTTTQEVQKVVQCAAASSLTVVARSGGHSYAAFGLGGKDGSLVVDLSKMKSLSVDPATGWAICQTGNLLGNLAQGIWDQAQRALPHGTCPYVGTGGHTAYGGFGMFGRTAGLLLDRVISAEVVLANGTVVLASSDSYDDLFWAIRGAAPSFGIVTQWTFDTLPAPPITINYEITYQSQVSKQDAARALSAMQSFAASNPSPKLSLLCPISPDQAGSVSFKFYGSFYGEESEFTSTIQPFINMLPGSPQLTHNSFNWIDGLVAITGPLDTSKPEDPNTFFAKSILIRPESLLSNDSWSSWVDYMTSTSTTLSYWSQLDMYGGVISDVAEDATAYSHRDAILNIQFYGSAPQGQPPFPQEGIAFMDGLVSSLEPNVQSAYPNYIDPTLTPEQWHTQYYANNYQRLTVLKKAYDPNNVFSFPQSIEVAP